ncbi:hypothetical protein F5Y14DRAFT_160863 [Nemania sp. NC0429]|nr:hypothetical protein F5Y14DRAFT_160863 [Nemania sp. NC0429]
MSQPQNARNMDESSWMGGPVRRTREETLDDVSRGSPLSTSDPRTVARRPQAPAGLQMKDGTIGMAISRPMPVPQWPLAGPVAPPVSVDSGSYRPPPDRLQPPQRPPRPSRVPSILDSSRVQDPTPAFQFAPQSASASELTVPETPATQSSRPSTLSSVGSIPDFPLPVATPTAPSRRSANLGPPPSSRRGDSSFYSTASYVSPIPEESPRKRSYMSYASSAAIPESFGSLSPGSQSDVYFDEAIAEESFISDDADDSRLVRSASLGKRGKPSLVTTKAVDKPVSISQRPSPKPIQGSPFAGGTGYVDGSSGSSHTSGKDPAVSALTTNTMLNAFEGASAAYPSAVPRMDPQPKSSRLSGLRRPPRLDIDAVREAEARGSLTSLPDLIRRATRLASMMDRGKRPASRFGELDFPDEMYGRNRELDNFELEKRQSGLSGMLAAFPPPASRRSMRQSLGSWPLPRGVPAGLAKVEEHPSDLDGSGTYKRRRRCCGLPLWGFMFVLFIVIAVIVAAVVVPVELLVKKNNAQPAQNCMQRLPCANGGTSVVSQGECSCICANGFMGKTCTTPAAQGCTTTTLETRDTTKITNVTIGQAIPRLVLEAQSKYSVPLSAASIISKFSSAGLSCNAENALVTFDGQSFRKGVARAGDPARIDITLTLLPGVEATIAFSAPVEPGHVFVTTFTLGGSRDTSATGYPTINPSSTSTPMAPSTTASSVTSRTTSTPSTTRDTSQPTGYFTVTDLVADFARTAVLYVLQEKSVDQASSAQNSLQIFFNSVDSNTPVGQAQNITIGHGNTVDLVNLFVDVGVGRVGGGSNSDGESI